MVSQLFQEVFLSETCNLIQITLTFKWSIVVYLQWTIVLCCKDLFTIEPCSRLPNPAAVNFCILWIGCTMSHSMCYPLSCDLLLTCGWRNLLCCCKNRRDTCAEGFLWNKSAGLKQSLIVNEIVNYYKSFTFSFNSFSGYEFSGYFLVFKFFQYQNVW